MVAFQGQAGPQLGRACIVWTLVGYKERIQSGCCLAALIRCGIEEVGTCGEFHPGGVE